MKQAEVVNLVLTGNKVVIGEFLGWEVRESPNSKKPGHFNVIATCKCLVGSEVVAVQKFQPDGTRAAGVARPAWKDRERVAIVFRSWENTRYGTQANGELHKLES